MRKTVKILVALIVGALLTAGVAVALTSIGVIQIGYEITPTAGEAPTLTPSSLSLDLGSIPSGSSGDKDFGKVATLDLPVGYEITVTLDTATPSDFPTFYVDIYLFEPGEISTNYVFSVSPTFNTDSMIIGAGTYDVKVRVIYTATTVTTTRTGTITIDISYPG